MRLLTARVPRLFSAVCLVALCTPAQAQFNPNPTLAIGDAAPAFTPQAWVRGQPLSGFRKGRVHVVDFWATWCGGCVMSFPRISGIAEQYRDRVTFVSVDSYEGLGENKGKDPVALVKAFLATPSGKKLTLDVAVDGPGNPLFQAWIKPLRRGGFPTTFIVDQEGRIAWIDVNLDHLTWALDQVLAGTWDSAKARDVMQGRDAAEDAMIASFKVQGPAHDKALREMLARAEAFEAQFPDRKDAVAFYKFMALLELDPGRLPGILEQMASDPLSRYLNLHDAAAMSLRRDDLPRAAYTAIVKVLERCLHNPDMAPNTGGSPSALLGEIASAHQKAGDTGKALVTLRRAVQAANAEQAPKATLEGLQKRLAQVEPSASGKAPAHP
ncbi:hypothetical protein METESE_31490 [Mesoterricola sediminis]|uniref:Thioredoxin domain-containing protein n=1 Tax=Mesoterricola sediminis TaxID=2927980 RepID=A0AA48GS02_9BACT|nr:hypothetical protein METESE_31490 [Mesoterricola sediminis]